MIQKLDTSLYHNLIKITTDTSTGKLDLENCSLR